MLSLEKISSVSLFDRNLLRRARTRAISFLPHSRFLLERAGEELIARLGDIKRRFPVAAHIGARQAPAFYERLFAAAGAETGLILDLCPALLSGQRGLRAAADEEFLPLRPGGFDLILSSFDLHTTNDLPGVLLQIRSALKPDGLFLAAMAGGETLHELRHSLTQAELTVLGGAGPRVLPFADKQQMGALLQRAGFALPVVDSDILGVTYPDLLALLRDLRHMGEGNIIAARRKTLTPRRLFLEAAAYYQQHYSDTDNRLRASFEIIYLIGWAPHDSQQKPLRPGSAQARLADALQTRERGADETARP